MRTLYLDCGMGAAGDMLLAALLHLTPDPQAHVDRLNALGLPGVHVAAASSVKAGITGLHVDVTVGGAREVSDDVPAGHDHSHAHGAGHDHHHGHAHGPEGHHHEHHHEHADDVDHAHRSLADVLAVIDALDLPSGVRADAASVYTLLAEAEGEVHGVPAAEVHFHEVGSLDAIADIVGVALLMAELAPERVVVSPIHVGAGQVRCAHGILPVPAPATALLLRGLPMYGGTIQGELCTPTGAALLRHFGDAFGPLPVLRADAVGYGMGTKDFPVANCVRAFLGTSDAAGAAGAPHDRGAGVPHDDTVTELACNVDDMTPEALGFAQEALFAAGALDVYTVAVGMKKSRPGVLLACIARPEDADRLVETILRHTTTLGVRVTRSHRVTLERTVETVAGPWGPVRVKVARGHGVERRKVEYDDAARIAREHGVPLAEVVAAVERSRAD